VLQEPEALTVTTVLALLLPPVPLQLRVKLEVVVRAEVVKVPEVNWLPLQAPLAVQLVALVVLQVRVTVLPEVIVDNEGVRVTVGAGRTFPQ
jgi:hypothetical protein